MFRLVFAAMLGIACQSGVTQEPNDRQPDKLESGPQDEIQAQFKSYAETFNRGDAAAVAQFWAVDGVSVDGESGERIVGRDALQTDFFELFEHSPGIRLTGELREIRLVRPDVAVVEGLTRLFLPDVDPVDSAFTAVLVKESDQWLISSSDERNLPSPKTPYDALRPLEWLVGVWQDDSEDSHVTTTVRWSLNGSFLIRSFHAQFADGETEGTQVIGWDPLQQRIRTWTFHSDGTFGEGTASQSGDDWLLNLTQVLEDGRISAATQIISRLDDDTIRVRTIGQTIDGAPVPAAAAVTVVRVAAASMPPPADVETTSSDVESAASTGDTP